MGEGCGPNIVGVVVVAFLKRRINGGDDDAAKTSVRKGEEGCGCHGRICFGFGFVCENVPPIRLVSQWSILFLYVIHSGGVFESAKLYARDLASSPICVCDDPTMYEGIDLR